ncbi:uncharacterized protein B0I36DRAFT_319506 [Microdochium trichocladiopsis]|uniref:Uncharacterized protein n=1 Tax=Microdochium trichocladiopsis TaxID=1682393 RepID=A0A9P8YCS6_9PEZI|nr:uncharacterized protein B0I36DRAFT_319506 [Microdochium trichocladiopsis]KAH7035991.1 hypothetical protein B0I36DRAFT_319506 [Microdochium trichocladiopsis]
MERQHLSDHCGEPQKLPTTPYDQLFNAVEKSKLLRQERVHGESGSSKPLWSGTAINLGRGPRGGPGAEVRLGNQPGHLAAALGRRLDQLAFLGRGKRHGRVEPLLVLLLLGEHHRRAVVVHAVRLRHARLRRQRHKHGRVELHRHIGADGHCRRSRLHHHRRRIVHGHVNRHRLLLRVGMRPRPHVRRRHGDHVDVRAEVALEEGLCRLAGDAAEGHAVAVGGDGAAAVGVQVAVLTKHHCAVLVVAQYLAVDGDGVDGRRGRGGLNETLLEVLEQAPVEGDGVGGVVVGEVAGRDASWRRQWRDGRGIRVDEQDGRGGAVGGLGGVDVARQAQGREGAGGEGGARGRAEDADKEVGRVDNLAIEADDGGREGAEEGLGRGHVEGHGVWRECDEDGVERPIGVEEAELNECGTNVTSTVAVEWDAAAAACLKKRREEEEVRFCSCEC